MNFKNSYIITFLVLLFTSYTNIFCQTLNPDFVRNVKVNELTDDQIRKIKSEMDQKGLTMASFENLAIANGMTSSDFSTLKTRIENLVPTQITQSNVESGTTITQQPIELNAEAKIVESEIYGAHIFNISTLSFEPNSNMLTPPTYILGPGDELNLVIYGLQEFSNIVAVSKEGKITIPIVGQIFVNGLTFEAAKALITKSCSRIYTSIATGQSKLSLTLSKIRSIKITIIGSEKPGNYTVSSLSTVFNALHIAGGPSKNGSYRKIELIRNNKVIKIIDIYKFLKKGDLSDNVNLLENDVIRIPVYENRVRIDGEVKRSGIFELIDNENFNDLLYYCSGFSESAYKANIKLFQNTDKELKIMDLSKEQYANYIPKSGDYFKISPILNRFENKISIRGAVYRPDDYELFEGMTLLDLLNKADGLTNDAYKNIAQLIREKEDLTKEMMQIDLNKILDGSTTVNLRKNDELVISSILELNSKFNVTINGQVKKEGIYPYVENLSLYDLIIQAGGFSEKASRMVEISSVIIKDEAIDQLETSIVKQIEIDTLLKDNTKNIKLKPNDIVQIRKKPLYEDQQYVTIFGEVYYPGNYVLQTKNEKFDNIIKRAGGLTNNANIEAIYLMRQADKLGTDSIEKLDRKIPIDYKRISKNPNSSKNFEVKPGDEIFIKKIDKNIKVTGNVYLNSEIPYSKGKKLKYYVNAVGGFNDDTDKKHIYVVKQNGLGMSTKRFMFFKKYPNIEMGSEIVVPKKKETINNDKISVTELSIITGVIGSLTGMTIAIINLLSK